MNWWRSSLLGGFTESLRDFLLSLSSSTSSFRSPPTQLPSSEDRKQPHCTGCDRNQPQVSGSFFLKMPVALSQLNLSQPSPSSIVTKRPERRSCLNDGNSMSSRPEKKKRQHKPFEKRKRICCDDENSELQKAIDLSLAENEKDKRFRRQLRSILQLYGLKEECVPSGEVICFLNFFFNK